MRDENMLQNANERGVQLMTGLCKLQEEYPQLGDVRGKGLMIGTEFVVDGRPEKAKPVVKQIVHAAEEANLLLLTCGTYDSTIRWIPPLNVTAGQINDGLQIFEGALKSTL
jgi:4-aminobutyrate aminotransferase-like enzyme